MILRQKIQKFFLDPMQLLENAPMVKGQMRKLTLSDQPYPNPHGHKIQHAMAMPTISFVHAKPTSTLAGYFEPLKSL